MFRPDLQRTPWPRQLCLTTIGLPDQVPARSHPRSYGYAVALVRRSYRGEENGCPTVNRTKGGYSSPTPPMCDATGKINLFPAEHLPSPLHIFKSLSFHSALKIQSTTKSVQDYGGNSSLSHPDYCQIAVAGREEGEQAFTPVPAYGSRG